MKLGEEEVQSLITRHNPLKGSTDRAGLVPTIAALPRNQLIINLLLVCYTYSTVCVQAISQSKLLEKYASQIIIMSPYQTENMSNIVG